MFSFLNRHFLSAVLSFILKNIICVFVTESSNIKDSDGKYSKSEVRITDYEYYLQRVCNAVILKYIGIKNTELDCSK